MKNISKLACTTMLVLFSGYYAQAQKNQEAKPQVAELPAISSEKTATDLSTAADRKGSEDSNVTPVRPGTTETAGSRNRTPAGDVKPVQPETNTKTVEKVRSTELNPQNSQPAAKPAAKIVTTGG